MADNDFLYAPEETASEPEGFTETQLKLTDAGHAAIEEAMKPVQRGLDKLTMNGGRGQDGIDLVDGSVLTVKETAAVAIAKDVIDDAERHHKKPIAELSVLELAKFADGRTEGRACSDAQVLGELMRLQNHAIYGNSVRRR